MRSAIAVLIPVLNEAQNLAWLLPQLTSKYRVIVADNGSTDHSRLVASANGAAVTVCKTRGYGNTLLAALQTLQDDVQAVVILDADGSSPPHYIDTLVEPIMAGDKDIVIAQRTALEKGAMPAHARFGNWLQTTLIWLFTGYRYKDMGPLRAISAEGLARLGMEDKTWGWNVEMQMKAVYRGLRIGEIDITYQKRKYGESKISGSFIGSVRAGCRILGCVFYYFVKERGVTQSKHYSSVSA